MDPNGDHVYVMDHQSANNIVYSLSEDEAKYVKFNRRGRLNTRRLNRCKSSSENMTALKALANSKVTYKFSVSNTDGEDVFFERGEESENSESFYYGVTKMPGMKNNPSKDNDVYIITAIFLDQERMVANVAHEGYGHAYFYERSLSDPSVNPNHRRSISDMELVFVEELNDYYPSAVFSDDNVELEQWIQTVVNQALENYNNWKR